MDWTGPNKKALRKALIDVYHTSKSLAKFISDELDLNLNVVSSESNLDDRAYDLIEECCAKGDKVNLLYQKLCEINPEHSAVLLLQKELKVEPLVEKQTRLTEADWTTLFSNFLVQDTAYVQIAFLAAFKSVHTDFWEIRPDFPPLNSLKQIRELLATYDQPTLAVRFTDYVIVEMKRAGVGDIRDLAPLKDWRNYIAEVHQILHLSTETSNLTPRQGYLLVALKESGRQTQKDGAFVTVFAELQVTGEPEPIAFDACSVTCPLGEVAGYLSDLIQNAEVALIPYECGEVTLELFLPCAYLEESVADWKVQNEQSRPRVLGIHRGFVVRSLERALDPKIQTTVRHKWQLLTNCVQTATVCDQFLSQSACPDPGILKVLLEDKLGLHFLSELPNDREHRIDIFYDIINAAVPIALWSAKAGSINVADLKTQFDELLRESQVTNFADLARKWRRKRIEPENEVIKHVRLLCDCPDRWPSLADPNQEEDLLVAS